MSNLFTKLILLLLILISVGAIVLSIYAFITYGSKPITEIPSWIIWFMK